ncbi:MAG: hypothetical protein ACJ8EL_07240 [Rhizomicrobium sp.]|jgi:hypothetical protein
MKEYPSRQELLRDLRTMIERWCDERKLRPLMLILPGYLSLNGLTDGWANLYEALKATRGLGYETFSPADWDSLNDLIHATETMVFRR